MSTEKKLFFVLIDFVDFSEYDWIFTEVLQYRK